MSSRQRWKSTLGTCFQLTRLLFQLSVVWRIGHEGGATSTNQEVRVLQLRSSGVLVSVPPIVKEASWVRSQDPTRVVAKALEPLTSSG